MTEKSPYTTLEFLSMVHDLQAQVNSVLVAIDNRLVLSTDGESVEMGPKTLEAVKDLLHVQSRLIAGLLEEVEKNREAVSLILDQVVREAQTDGPEHRPE